MSETIKASYVQQDQFQQIITDNDIVVVDYTASWCGPCRVVAPLMDRLATEYAEKVTVVKIDLDQNPDNALSFLRSD